MSYVICMLCIFSKHLTVRLIQNEIAPRIISAGVILKAVHTGQGRERVEVKGGKCHTDGTNYSQGQSG